MPAGFAKNAAKKKAGGAAKVPPSKGGGMPMDSGGIPAFLKPKKAAGKGKTGKTGKAC